MHLRLEQEFEKGRSAGGVIGELRLFSWPRRVAGFARLVQADSRTETWRAWRSGFLLAAACVTFLFESGCRKPNEPQTTVAIEYWISPQPIRVGPAIVNVKLRDAAGKPVAGARLSLEADMSHPGMAPVFGAVREDAPGQYAGSLDFAMPGDWVLLIHVTLPDGRKLEREVSVPGVTTN
jgi:hypothetical protein